MRNGKRHAWIAGLCFSCLIVPAAKASTFTVLAQLSDVQNPAGVTSAAASDSFGNLYFETIVTNTANEGALYRLTAKSAYASAERLYTFTGNNNFTAPAYPYSAVIFRGGAIYGAATADSYGTVFTLGKPSAISEVTLHVFLGNQVTPTDGEIPGDLVSGPSSRFYGATTYGGNYMPPNDTQRGSGTIFSIVPSTTNPNYQVLHRFGAAGDGVDPTSVKLAVDTVGRLYGVTYKGGANRVGTVFMLEQDGGAWQEKVIYSFQSNQSYDLELPTGNVVLDKAGNIYGCAEDGRHGQGGIFELMPPTQGDTIWREQTLYTFGYHPHDPVAAFAGSSGEIGQGCGISMDPNTGLIVGTSYGGGTYGAGTIFTLAPPQPGGTSWTETVAHSFRPERKGGYNPVYPLLELNGVYYGGSTASGAIYSFVP